MKMMISLSLRSKLLRQFSGATTPPGLRGGGAKCFQARRVEMDHPSGCHDDGGDDNVVDDLCGADVSAGVDGKGRVRPIRMNFWKISKQPLTLLLIFGKLYCNFSIMNMVAYMQGGMRDR